MKVSTADSPKMMLSRAGAGNVPTSTGTLDFVSFIKIVYVDISFDNTITLSHTPISKTENVVFNGVILTPGIAEDYRLVGNKILFNRTDFKIDDKITIFYNYMIWDDIMLDEVPKVLKILTKDTYQKNIIKRYKKWQ